MKSSESKLLKWAILTTGYGKNAYDTISSFQNKTFKKSKLEVLIYEQEPCGAADLAKEYDINTVQILRKDYKDALQYQKKLIKLINQYDIDFIFLLNYKYKIREEMLSAFPDRILNIHPSLFPSFLGTKTAIQDALDYGVKVTGITTHIIDDKLDEGIIMCQKAIKIKDADTFETLYPQFAVHGHKLIVKTIKKVEKSS